MFVGKQKRGGRGGRDPGRGLGGALGYVSLFFTRFGYLTCSDKCNAFITVQEKNRRKPESPALARARWPVAKKQWPTCRGQGAGRGLHCSTSENPAPQRWPLPLGSPGAHFGFCESGRAGWEPMLHLRGRCLPLPEHVWPGVRRDVDCDEGRHARGAGRPGALARPVALSSQGAGPF